MPWQSIECSDGAYDLHSEEVMRMIRSLSWSSAVLENSKIVTEVNTWGPNIDNLENYWKAVCAQTDSTANDLDEDSFKRLEYGSTGSSCLLFLRDLVDEKTHLTRRFRC
jgi:hypothetical protein